MTETTATPPPADPTAAPPIPTTDPLFVRPRSGRMLGGVCAGIAARWGLDVTLVRIATVVVALVSGIGFVAYVAAWLLTPSDDAPAPLQAGSPLAQRVARGRGRWWLRRFPSLLLIVLGALIVLVALHHVWFGVPIGLVVLVTLLVLVFGTRAGRWMAVLVAAFVAVVIAMVGIFGDHFGTRSYQVASVSDLRSSYNDGVGTIRLDLSGISAVSGRHETHVHLGRGRVTVKLPRDVAVVVRARAGVGSVSVDGHRVSGIDAEETRPIGPSDATSVDKLVVDITVGVGSVTVR